MRRFQPVPVVRPIAACIPRRSRGFTLLEALTVVAVMAVLLAIATPPMRDLILKNKVSGLSNEFSGALQQSRALAISNNSCVTLCAATGVSATATLTCAPASPSNYQLGWIIFRNPACDPLETNPTAAGGAVLSARRGDDNGYRIKPNDDALNLIMFDPRGSAALSVQGLFQVYAPSGAPDSFNRSICVDPSGRAAVKPYNSANRCS